MYESKKHPPLAWSQFLTRMGNHLLAAIGLLFISLLLGISGYLIFENLSLTDAFLNASMLLGGMGPVNMPVTTGGKIFAGFYALYSGLVFIVSAALIFTPVLHRVLHRFHWD
jgi:hypothetical protein